MQQIINFILRNKSFLLYVLLFAISLFLTIQSHSYHKSKFINSANAVSGGVYNMTHGISEYFDLKKQNAILSEENNRLKALLYGRSDSLIVDSLSFTSNFNFVSAEVIKNSYTSYNNYLTINKGSKDGIGQDFGVITANGIVGIIDNVSNGYARVVSVLNTKIRVNAKLKNSNHFGSLKWDGKLPNVVQLVDMPKQAPVELGDTIITGGLSSIFPKGIPVGKILSFDPDETGNYIILQVELFNDMSNLGYVNVIENRDMEEIESLETSDE